MPVLGGVGEFWDTPLGRAFRHMVLADHTLDHFLPRVPPSWCTVRVSDREGRLIIWRNLLFICALEKLHWRTRVSARVLLAAYSITPFVSLVRLDDLHHCAANTRLDLERVTSLTSVLRPSLINLFFNDGKVVRTSDGHASVASVLISPSSASASRNVADDLDHECLISTGVLAVAVSWGVNMTRYTSCEDRRSDRQRPGR